jgi:hypothetical protein
LLFGLVLQGGLRMGQGRGRDSVKVVVFGGAGWCWVVLPAEGLTRSRVGWHTPGVAGMAAERPWVWSFCLLSELTCAFWPKQFGRQQCTHLAEFVVQQLLDAGQGSSFGLSGERGAQRQLRATT